MGAVWCSERGRRKNEESAFAWLMLMVQNLNSYLSPDFLLGSGNLREMVVFTISTLRLRMAPPKTSPQHCVIGRDGGPIIPITCSSLHRGDTFKVSFLVTGGEPNRTQQTAESREGLNQESSGIWCLPK